MSFYHVFLLAKIRVINGKTGGLFVKLINKGISIVCLSVLLTGCGDRLTEIKEAASGINGAAHSAANALSKDVHSVRAIHLSYNEETFTLNDVFKSILRDTRWEYDAQAEKLQVKGTWLEPLFADQHWDNTYKKKLAETGEITVTLRIQDDKIHSALTDVKLVYDGETILHMTGEDALFLLYETYLQK